MLKRLMRWLTSAVTGGFGRVLLSENKPDALGLSPELTGVPWPDPSNDIPSVAHLYGLLPPEEGEEKPTYIFPSKPPDFDPPASSA